MHINYTYRSVHYRTWWWYKFKFFFFKLHGQKEKVFSNSKRILIRQNGLYYFNNSKNTLRIKPISHNNEPYGYIVPHRIVRVCLVNYSNLAFMFRAHKAIYRMYKQTNNSVKLPIRQQFSILLSMHISISIVVAIVMHQIHYKLCI